MPYPVSFFYAKYLTLFKTVKIIPVVVSLFISFLICNIFYLNFCKSILYPKEIYNCRNFLFFFSNKNKDGNFKIKIKFKIKLFISFKFRQLMMITIFNNNTLAFYITIKIHSRSADQIADQIICKSTL